MRVPAKWLRAHCDPALSTAEIGAALNASGTGLERIEHHGVGSADGFLVGRVLAAERHPDADRLTVCTVDDGSGQPRTIVCGAPNVSAGQTVAVALPGALMPDGTQLREATLRGVRSSGMILAEDELGIGQDHAGILVLADELEPGLPLAAAIPIDDEVLELEINPNRPDCLGVFGVARELHALTGAPLTGDPRASDAEALGSDHAEDHVEVEVADPEICLRFTARVFEDVRVGPSPPWLKARLSAAGQRPISNVVDITNYVMLATSQPLHAFDLDRVRGRRIVVRRAFDGERITTLDGAEHGLDTETAVVCDAEGPSGIAGIMGGRISEVEATTERVLMEAATWVGPNIMRTEARLGLRTEASGRFEKQLHPALTLDAQALAARLMVELCGARLVPGTIDVYPAPAGPRSVRLRPGRVERLLGAPIPADESAAMLSRLGFSVGSGDERGLEVGVPYFRDGDIQREVDLIEELARVHGLEKLPTTLPARRAAVGRLSSGQRLRRRLEDALRDRGLAEVITYSFTSPAALARLRLDGAAALRLANPLSEDASVMRPLLLSGLLDAARHNAARGRAALALFESAHVYLPGDGDRGALEPHHLAAVLTEAAPAGWRSRASEADFYAARAIAESVLAIARLDWQTAPSVEPFLHPGRQAAIVAGGRTLGHIGELHPAIAGELDLGRVACLELDAGLIVELAPGPAAYRDVTTFPAVLQDLAVVVADEVPAARVEATLRAAAGTLLERLSLFDVYRGDQVGPGRKSLALRLEFRSPERTLTDRDVGEVRAAIERALAEIGGSLRA
ncbi:MAG: phenylalanine--tRNA ligase subunit beta [Thermoleophilaceae bacterium]